jgi:hypothetical protein
VLTQYRKFYRGNIGICPPSCCEPLGEATDYKSPISSSESPWRIPIWREGGKKKAVVRRSWEILCAWRESLGGGQGGGDEEEEEEEEEEEGGGGKGCTCKVREITGRRL